MRLRWKLCALILLPALLVMVAPEPARADNSSDGAAITLGILAASLVVLFTVSLMSDIDHWRMTEAESTQPIDLAEMQKSLPIVVLDLRPTESESGASLSTARLEDFGVGLTFEF